MSQTLHFQHLQQLQHHFKVVNPWPHRPMEDDFHRYTEVPNNKNPPKITWFFFVTLTGHSYAWNNLINFKYSICNYRKRKLCKSTEIDFEKFVKSHQVNLFWVRFSHLESLCARRRRPRQSVRTDNKPMISSPIILNSTKFFLTIYLLTWKL